MVSSSSGSDILAIRCLAIAISAADICAKSFTFRTSRSETVRRAENSVFPTGSGLSCRGAANASATRATVRCAITMASNAHRRPRRDSFARGSAALLVS